MNAVFELGGELVRPDIAHNLMRLIAEGSGEDEAADMAMRTYAASQYYELLEKPVLPPAVVTSAVPPAIPLVATVATSVADSARFQKPTSSIFPWNQPPGYPVLNDCPIEKIQLPSLSLLPKAVVEVASATPFT